MSIFEHFGYMYVDGKRLIQAYRGQLRGRKEAYFAPVIFSGIYAKAFPQDFKGLPARSQRPFRKNAWFN